MTGRVVVDVENLSKFYRLGVIGGGTLREDLTRWWAKVRGRPDPLLKIDEVDHGNRDGQQLWALRDVSFQVREGEVLGVIGRNGAGKSTLLKILSRITAPTTGRATICGRVGSLLEVGTGFHPELTGRENIYLNGAILGMKRAEITRKLTEIIEFAEMARFIDTPVKRYSSGMIVRLAFAVAAHLEPEVLIVDEVLAVGDAEFQKKCLGKMKDVASRGRTVLFVSHNMQAVGSLCTRGLLFSAGRATKYDGVQSAIDDYLRGAHNLQGMVWRGEEVLAGGSLCLKSLRIMGLAGNAPIDGSLRTSNKIAIDFALHIGKPVRGLCVGFDLFSQRGDLVLRSYDTDFAEDLTSNMSVPQNVVLRCEVPQGLLNAGRYRLAPRIGVHNQSWLLFSEPLLEFDSVLDHGRTAYWGSLDANSRPGGVAPIFQWTRLEGSIINDAFVGGK